MKIKLTEKLPPLKITFSYPDNSIKSSLTAYISQSIRDPCKGNCDQEYTNPQKIVIDGEKNQDTARNKAAKTNHDRNCAKLERAGRGGIAAGATATPSKADRSPVCKKGLTRRVMAVMCVGVLPAATAAASERLALVAVVTSMNVAW